MKTVNTLIKKKNAVETNIYYNTHVRNLYIGRRLFLNIEIQHKDEFYVEFVDTGSYSPKRIVGRFVCYGPSKITVGINDVVQYSFRYNLILDKPCYTRNMISSYKGNTIKINKRSKYFLYFYKNTNYNQDPK